MQATVLAKRYWSATMFQSRSQSMPVRGLCCHYITREQAYSGNEIDYVLSIQNSYMKYWSCPGSKFTNMATFLSCCTRGRVLKPSLVRYIIYFLHYSHCIVFFKMSNFCLCAVFVSFCIVQ